MLCSGGAAPTIFATLAPDRATAGLLAARIFEISYWIAAGVAVLLSARAFAGDCGALLKAASGMLLLATGFQLFWIVPALRDRGQGWPFSFASLHASASIVHGAMLLLSLLLAWLLSGHPRPARGQLP